MDRRVALAHSADYEPSRVEGAVRRAVDLLGGITSFVKPGQRVVVKPNLVLPSHPDRAVVTHPAVGRAVVLLVQEAGGQAVIAENPGVSPTAWLGWKRTFQRSGWEAVAEETGAELITSVTPQQRSHPSGKLIRLVDTCDFVTEADVIISLPKLKGHGLMRFTGAVKNLFGTVPGATKYGYHVKLQTIEQFAEMLLDVASFVRPALTVMDAVVAMAGDGPSAGDPFRVGTILAAPDPVALDVAAVSLIGHQPTNMPTIAAAIGRGWTTGRVDDLVLLGDDLDRLRVSGFRLPGGGRKAPGRAALLRRVGTHYLVSRPMVTDRCVGCGLCILSCPAQAMLKLNGRAHIDSSQCIRCYCCHEFCPVQAIDLREPWFARLLERVGL